MSISSAFAAVLLSPLNEEGFSFHWVGDSSLGKTTMLRAAGSVWGGGGQTGYLQSWQATANGVEAICEAHNDLPLCIDEIGVVKAEDMARLAYQIASGIGRQRTLSSGMGATRREWRTIGLSTGEITLADKLREAKAPQRIMAGQEVRFVNLPADAGHGFGIFDCIPAEIVGDTNQVSGKRFADRLKEASSKVYGTAGPAFVAEFINDKMSSIEQAAQVAKEFVNAEAPEGKNQAQRVAHRFGIIAAAGELATNYGITGWEFGEAIEAAKVCFSAWLAQRGGSDDSEGAEIVTHLRSVIERDGASRFQRVGSTDPVTNRLGYVKEIESGCRHYLIFPEAWKAVFAGRNPNRAAFLLREAGIVAPADSGRTHSKERIGSTTERFIVVRHGVLFGDESPSQSLPEELPHG